MKRELWIAILLICLTLPVHGEEKISPDKLVKRKCSACHTPPKPGKLSEEQLQARWTRHGKKLRRLNKEQKRAIIDYLK